MKNHNGDSMRIDIKKYHFDNLYNKVFDSDWLDAELVIKNDIEETKIKLEFLIIEELERIINWLLELSNNGIIDRQLNFIDSNMKLKLFTRSKIKVVKMLYNLNNNTIESWELIVTKTNLLLLADEIKKIIVAYPCRCGLIHKH